MVLNDKVRKTLEEKEDIKKKRQLTENIITTLAFLSFLKFFGGALILLSGFFFVETTFRLNVITLVFLAMGFFFLISGVAWGDKLKKRLRHDIY